MRRVGRRAVPIVVLAALLALVGGAAPAAATNWRLPVRDLTVSPASSGALVDDRVVLWSNGSASGHVDLLTRSTRLQFSAWADHCEGGARVEVRVDGRLALAHEVVGSAPNGYVARGDWAPGRHHVSFRFTNDLLTDRCDRNLKISHLVFNGPEPGSGIDYGGYVRQRPTYDTTTFSPVRAGATGRQPPVLWGPGTMRILVDSQAADRLHVNLWRAACPTTSEVRVRLDGEPLLAGERRTQWRTSLSHEQALGRPGSWPDGPHVLEIELLDDVDDGCDQHVGISYLYFSGDV